MKTTIYKMLQMKSDRQQFAVTAGMGAGIPRRFRCGHVTGILLRWGFKRDARSLELLQFPA